MQQRRKVEGSVVRCGSARSLLLDPGAAHLNQKTWGQEDCLRPPDKHIYHQEQPRFSGVLEKVCTGSRSRLS